MKILNIAAYQHENKIEIQLTSLLDPKNSNQIRSLDFDFLKLLEKYFYHLDDSIITSLKLKENIENRSVFYMGELIDIHYVVTTYQFPTDPHLALNFLAAIDTYINIHKFDFVLQTERNIEKILDETELDLSELVAMYLLSEKASKKLIQHLPTIFIDALQEYEAIFYALLKLNNFYNSLPLHSNIDALEAKNRFLILHDINIINFCQNELSNEDQLKLKFILARKLLNENNRSELNFYLCSLHHEAKVKLLFPLIGDTENKCWDQTEIKFLMNTEFCLRSDGRISIALQNNSIYHQLYSAEIFCNKLELNFKSFAELINLKFSTDTNFLEELIFDEESSKKLISFGLHFTPEYFKNLLKIKNTVGFFNQRSFGVKTSDNILLPIANAEKIITAAASKTIGQRDNFDAIKIGLNRQNFNYFYKQMTSSNDDDDEISVVISSNENAINVNNNSSTTEENKTVLSQKELQTGIGVVALAEGTHFSIYALMQAAGASAQALNICCNAWPITCCAASMFSTFCLPHIKNKLSKHRDEVDPKRVRTMSQ